VHNFLTETVRDDGNEIRQGLWWLDYPGLVRGKWTLRVSLGRQPATVIPVTVLGAGDPAPPNRPPHRPRASLYPRIPSADAVIICRVANPGVAGDPDLDRVRYRYVWSVDGETVRDAVSAVRADYLPSGAAASGATVRCQVYAGDGQQTAPPTNLSARVR